MIPKGLQEIEIKERVETIQNKVLDRPEYLDESKTPDETCCHSIFIDIPPANDDVKNSRKVK